MSEWQTAKTSDGGEMQLYVARPSGAPKGGIIVIQEIFGVNAHIRDVTERFAKLGLLAIAPDCFHRSEQKFADDKYEQRDKARKLMGEYSESHMAADMQATYDWLKNELGNDNIAATGYCLGGKVSFLANAILPLKCAVVYYGGILPIIAQAKNQHGPLLMCWGGKDQNLKLETPHKAAEELQKQGKAFTNVVFSNANHAFFCDARENYHEPSAKQSWILVREFLSQNLGT